MTVRWTSITEFKEFAGRTHYIIIAGKGWEEIADFVLNSAQQQNLVAGGWPLATENGFWSKKDLTLCGKQVI